MVPRFTQTEDFTSVSGTLTFAPGETSKSVLVQTVDDTFSELTESFTVNLSNPIGGVIIRGTGTGRILDNDPIVLTRSLANVTGNLLSTLTNTGTWSFPQSQNDLVTLTASLGDVVKNANGTCVWSLVPSTKLVGQQVTIAANYGTNNSSVTFTVDALVAVSNRQVYYLGHLRGEIYGQTIGGAYFVNNADLTAALPVGQVASVGYKRDVDKNGFVLNADFIIIRLGIVNGLVLRNITIPASGSADEGGFGMRPFNFERDSRRSLHESRMAQAIKRHPILLGLQRWSNYFRLEIKFSAVSNSISCNSPKAVQSTLESFSDQSDSEMTISATDSVSRMRTTFALRELDRGNEASILSIASRSVLNAIGTLTL